mgnify:CR=1 FL=1
MRQIQVVCAIFETEPSAYKDQDLSFKIIIGGVPVSKEFTDAIGPEGYEDDAPGAVEQINRIVHVEEKAAYLSIFQSYCIY